MKTSELTGTALDWAVGVAQGMQWERDPDIGLYHRSPSGSRYVLKMLDYATMDDWSLTPYAPTESWSVAGPIIEREFIQLGGGITNNEPRWFAIRVKDDKSGACKGHGPTPLIAAMRCFVASRLGDEVEIPSEIV